MLLTKIKDVIVESSVKAFVNTYVHGERKPHITFYNNSDASDYDLSFTQEYNIKNQGPASITGSSLTIKFPLFAPNGDPIIKIKSEFAKWGQYSNDLKKLTEDSWFPTAKPIRMMKWDKQDGYLQCRLVNFHSMQLALLDLQRTYKPLEKGTATFDCGAEKSAICGEFLCQLGLFEESLTSRTYLITAIYYNFFVNDIRM